MRKPSPFWAPPKASGPFDAFNTQLPEQEEAMFGFDDPMGQSVQSGRSFMDPMRAFERQNRLQDRTMRQAAANFGAGGGSRGGGGGRSQAPLIPPPQFEPQGPVDPQVLSDMALVKYGNAPSLGMEYAMASARQRAGQGGLGDYALIQQRDNPNLPSGANQAAARQRFRRNTLRTKGGLVGAAQQALYT